MQQTGEHDYMMPDQIRGTRLETNTPQHMGAGPSLDDLVDRSPKAAPQSRLGDRPAPKTQSTIMDRPAAPPKKGGSDLIDNLNSN